MGRRWIYLCRHLLRCLSCLDLVDVMQINMVSGYEIYGAYQPDTIKAFSAGGRNYMVTANEGDAKVRSPRHLK